PPSTPPAARCSGAAGRRRSTSTARCGSTRRRSAAGWSRSCPASPAGTPRASGPPRTWSGPRPGCAPRATRWCASSPSWSRAHDHPRPSPAAPGHPAPRASRHRSDPAGAASVKFDALINEGEYFPPFYLDEILPKQLKSGRLKEWAAEERQGRPTPRQGLRDLTAPYLDVRLGVGGEADKYNPLPDQEAVAAQQRATEALKDHTGPDGEPPAFRPAPAPRAYGDGPEEEWRAGLHAWHARVLKALGFTPRPGHLTVHGAAGPVAVPVAHSEPGVAVLTGGFADDLAATRGDGPANRLPAPVRVASGKTLTTVTDLAAWLLSADSAPRYALLLFGGIMVLADRENYARGRHLAVSLGVALPRKGVQGASAGELDVIAALCGAQALRPAEDGGDDDIARLVAESRDHSVGVTSDPREGLKASVQLIANEVLDLARARNVTHDDLPEWLP